MNQWHHGSIDFVKEIIACLITDFLNGHPILHEEGSEEGHKGNVVVAIVLEINVNVPSKDPGVA